MPISITKPAHMLRAMTLTLLFAVALSVSLRPAVAEELTMNFREADIRAVIETVAEITGKSFIIDPRVQGKITIISPEPIDSAMLYEVILSALQVHGYQAVDDGAVTRIIPFTQSFQLAGGGEGNQIETAVIKTNYLKASELLPTVKPMISKGALVQAHDASNHLIVTDTKSQISRVRKVINEMDDSSNAQVEVIALQHISAGEAVNIASQLRQFNDSSISIVQDTFSNRLIVSGSPKARRDLKNIIRSLDVPGGSSGTLEVIHLQYSQAEPMKAMLENLITSSLFEKATGESGEKEQQGYKIEADIDNNAIIIAAAPDVAKELSSVVRRLDIPRKQVLIEAIVAEISEDQAKRLSVQLAGFGEEGGAIINFNQLLPALIGLGLEDDLTAEDFANVPLGTGLTGGGVTFNESDNRGFALLLEALKQDANTNILSTPSVVTMDNHEATISVGQEVPFITGNYISNNNTVDNPFQTIEREEIGIKLRVRPQISEGDVIRMAIEQETSNLLASAQTVGAADVITAKRVINTNVMVGDGEFLVLGGLIDDSFSADDSRVPILGDIPVLGHLFRSTNRNNEHSVLMVFIHPQILEKNGDSVKSITNQRYQFLRQRQAEFIERFDDEGSIKPLPEMIEEVVQPGQAPSLNDVIRQSAQ